MDISYSRLFEIFLDHDVKSPKDFVATVMRQFHLVDKNIPGIESLLLNFYYTTKKKWNEAKRSKINFQKNRDWLSSTLRIDTTTTEDTDDLPSSSSGSRGRPKKQFEECAAYTKRQKLLHVTEEITTENLSQTLEWRYRQENENTKSFVVKALSAASPIRVQRIKESIPTPQSDPVKFTNENALALFID